MSFSERQDPLQETDPDALRHLARVQVAHDEQYLALKRRAQGLFAAVKGQTGVHTPEAMEKVFEKARDDYDSGAFLLERLGTSRYIDPELVAVLVQLRHGLLSELERPTAADRLHVDMAVLAYRNTLRLQSLFSSALMECERQLFGQSRLEDVMGQVEANAVSETLEKIERQLLPMLEKAQRMMNRALDRLDARRQRNSTATVSIASAGQVNVAANSTRNLDHTVQVKVDSMQP